MYVQVFTIPPDCENTSCNYMARWFRDGDDLLFELSANTDGWAAIALSGDGQMSGAAFDDVIACQAEPGGGRVNAKDMNNPTGMRRNALDTVSREGSDISWIVCGSCTDVCTYVHWGCYVWRSH